MFSPRDNPERRIKSQSAAHTSFFIFKTRKSQIFSRSRAITILNKELTKFYYTCGT